MNKTYTKRIYYNLTIALLMVILQIDAQSIDSSLNYFPMHNGDRWDYYGYMISQTPYYSLIVEIIGDTISSNGFRYMIFKENHSVKGISIYWKRLDSISGSIYLRLPSQAVEIQEDSLRAMPGDYFQWNSYHKRCNQMIPKTILGIQTTAKSFSGLTFYPYYMFAYNIGLFYWSLDDGMRLGLEERKLVYAKIQDKEYGTPLSVTDPLPIPKTVNLKQNYPNPFNPRTIIEFNLSKKSIVKLTIFNVVGQIISEWIYPTKQEGNYSISWSPQSASGVYYYKLETKSLSYPNEQYTETKKMIFIK